MPQRIEERVRPITPQLAWRVAVLGGIAFALFAIVFFRLWFLQVLSGQDYVLQARENRVRNVPIEAPRGDIVDRHNNKLVRSKRAAVVQLVPSRLPQSVRDQADEYRQALAAAEGARLLAADRLRAFERQLRDDGRASTREEKSERRRLRREAARARPVTIPPPPPEEAELLRLYRRMGEVINVRPSTIHERVITGIADAPYSNVTIKTDVPPAQFNYMRERPEYYPGVEVTKRFLRLYPHGELAAQLFGTVSEITDKQLDMDDYAGSRAGHADRPERPRAALRQVPARRRRLLARRRRRHGQPRRAAPRLGQRSQAGAAAEADARPRPAAGRRRGAPAGDRQLRVRDPRRRVRRDGPDRRLDPRHRLPAELRRERVREAVLAEDLRVPDLGRHGRAAAQPRHRVRLSDGLGVQADHGARGPRSTAWSARTRRSTTPATSSTATRSTRTPRRRASAPSTRRTR